MVVDLVILTPDDWRLWRELRLEALREAPAAFGSTLADWQGAGDQEARWRQRLTSVPFNVVARSGGKPAGMVSGLRSGENAELISLWVAPCARGQGVGDRLILAVVDWARAAGAPRVVLSVKQGNEPAAHLYRRHGFVEAGRSPESEPGSPEDMFVKSL